MTGRNVGVLFGPILLAETLRTSGSWALASPVFGTVTALALLSGAYLAFELAAADHPAPNELASPIWRLKSEGCRIAKAGFNSLKPGLFRVHDWVRLCEPSPRIYHALWC
jgi:hypothetical protein